MQPKRTYGVKLTLAFPDHSRRFIVEGAIEAKTVALALRYAMSSATMRLGLGRPAIERTCFAFLTSTGQAERHPLTLAEIDPS